MECIINENIKIINDNCLNYLENIKDESIDCVITDLKSI